MDQSVKFNIFIGVWIVLGIATVVFLKTKMSATTRRKRIRQGAIATPILFAGFIVWMTEEPRILMVLVPALTLIAYLNVRFTKVCDECGAIAFPSTPLQKTKFCSGCGKPTT